MAMWQQINALQINPLDEIIVKKKSNFFVGHIEKKNITFW
jgi:hypothetical protein